MNRTGLKMTNRDSENKRIGDKFFWFLVIAAVLHMIYYYPLLPDRMASHFDACGRANGWSGKSAFFSIYSGVVLLMAFIQIMTRRSLAKSPVSLINLPNKEYWLAPLRRAESMAILEKYMSGFWSATFIFLICTMDLAFRANLGRSQALGEWFFVFLATFILFTLAWTVSLIRRFARKPDQRPG
jgi:uncharacterized membrane protein